VGATEAEKSSPEFQGAAQRIKEMEERINARRANYLKTYGKDYDPTRQ
jgi:hypothetical protein